MKILFATLIGLLAVFSAFMVAWKPGARSEKPQLVWTSDDNPLRKEQVELFERMNPDLELSLDPVNQGMEKVIVQSLGGVGPDLFDCRDANQLSAYVNSGIALDVTDELARMGIDLQKQVWPSMLSYCRLDGRDYGVPTNVGANAIWVNARIFREEGIAIPRGPWKWPEFVVLAQKLTKRDASGRVVRYGFLCDWYMWPHFLLGYGAQIFSEDGTRCELGRPEAAQAIQVMRDLICKYKVTPSPVEEASLASAGGWGPGSINLFGAGRGAMALGGRWWLANLRRMDGLELRVVESPYGLVRSFGAVGRATLVNGRSPRRREAMRFLAYLASAEYNHLINDQADGICAFTKYAQGPAFEVNSDFPGERDNLVWREVTAHSASMRTSPFINGQEASRLIERQLDLVRIGAKEPGPALREAARQVDQRIAENIAADPHLRALLQSRRSRP